jgi:hypothetical protein
MLPLIFVTLISIGDGVTTAQPVVPVPDAPAVTAPLPAPAPAEPPAAPAATAVPR